MGHILETKLMRSLRLTHRLTSCSTTPRSGQHFVDQLARDRLCETHEQIYEEAKLALTKYDTETADILFRQCPGSYKNTQRYRRQCELFRQLCATGILQREQTAALRVELADVVQESDESLVVGKYAELLYEVGYTANSLREMSVYDVQGMCSLVNMPYGYMTLIRAHVLRRTDPCTWFFFHVTHCIERCGGVQACAKMAIRGIRRSNEGEEEEETAE